MYNINGLSFDSLVENLSNKFNISPASAYNLINGVPDVVIAEICNICPADLDCIYVQQEASSKIAEKLELSNSELDNLIKLHGKSFSIGLLMGYLIGKFQKK